jgi:Sec-independent protein translocase protein TatA
MAFGTELILLLGSGFVLLGPKRMQKTLGQIGHAKAQFDKATRGFLSDVTSGRDEKPQSDAGMSEHIEHSEGQGTGLVLPDDLFERILQREATCR